jgi:hypothetical protein
MNIVKKRDKPLSEVISQYIREDVKVLKGMSAIRLEEVYHQVVGATISKYTEYVRFDSKLGKLSVFVKSAPLKAELNLQKEKIVTLINEKVGTDLIQTIHIK